MSSGGDESYSLWLEDFEAELRGDGGK